MLSLLALLPLACSPKPGEPAAAAPAPSPDRQMVEDLAALRFDRLGNPVLRWDHVPALSAPEGAPHKALVVLVEFSDTGFDRFAGDPEQDVKLAAYYQKLLFDSNYERKNTLSHYYATQSDGKYHLDGIVLPPVRLDKPLSAYGRPTRPEGGTWRNDRDPDGLVEDALRAAVAAQPDLEWSEFDRWDNKDFDHDGVTDEPDGYLDHLIIVYAGGGQHSCQSLRKLDEALNPNVGEEALDDLSPEQLACADRIWPHRDEVRMREGEGPTLADGEKNPNGGVPLHDDLWVRNYNMQCEYTEQSTFIHETGHSLGLPDIYARTSSNSTGLWEVMSGTADPSPQNMSAWSRIQLGWLKPEVVLPPSYGGDAQVTVNLARLDDPTPGAAHAAMIVLPPKKREIDLVKLPESSGSFALYSGQGNDLDRKATLALHVPDEGEALLEFDAWWEIEGGWDFAYFEVSDDGGRTWTRQKPTDPRMMPAKHGHDGPNTLPGFTGLSGDLDGDGKDESNPACDPTAEIAHGEDRAGAEKSPCEDGAWVHVAFDLSKWRGRDIAVRWRYFTDGAAVEDGLLVDNVKVPGGAVQTFEDDAGWADGAVPEGWTLDGFSRSPGHHTVLVPHYYVLEVRDPYADPDSYDAALAEPTASFIWNPDAGRMELVRMRPRPGVVAWYFDGAYAWSENDPALNGPGHGYLLVVDSNPNEISLPAVRRWYEGDPAKFDTRYELKDEDGGEAAVQEALHDSFVHTLCFVRNPPYWPADLERAALKEACGDGPPPVESLDIDGKKGKYVYEYIDLLPGEAREPWRKVGELVDFRKRDGAITWRLRDRSLRYLHTFDAPFAVEPFADGLVVQSVEDGAITDIERHDHPAFSHFSDEDPARWLNPHLPFGGVAVPQVGLSWDVAAPAEDAPPGTAATVRIAWTRRTASLPEGATR